VAYRRSSFEMRELLPVPEVRILFCVGSVRYNEYILAEECVAMNDDEQLIEAKDPVNPISSPHPSTYELLVRQSKKLGGVATSAIHGAQHILTREITMPSAEQFLGNFPRRTQSRKQQELEQADNLKKVVKRSNEILGSANTVFPVTLFPDSILVDRTKVSIIKRDFFWTSNTITFQVEDILNVSCGIGPVFGSLTIASRVMSTIDHFQINYLWRSDAIFLKRLIQGHIIAKQNKLETNDLTRKEMVETLCELGMDADR
jgi:hypothetical protein